MRREDDSPIKVGDAQLFVCGLIQHEVGKPVVDQVNRIVPVPQHTVMQTQCRRIGDHRLDAMPAEQLLEQDELGVEILILRVVVDDGDAPQRLAAARQPPFREKHVGEALVERAGRDRCGGHARNRRAARPLRARQHGIEKRATGVGVDLDQLRFGGGDVEVETQEYTLWATRIKARYRRRRFQHEVTVRGQCDDRLCRSHHCRHALQTRPRHKHRNRREHMRGSLQNQRINAARAGAGFKLALQYFGVKADAEAFAVERFNPVCARLCTGVRQGVRFGHERYETFGSRPWCNRHERSKTAYK